MVTSPRFDKVQKILNWVAVIAVILTLGIIFFYAPTERTMGNVQRIFYFHVGSAWVGAIAFFIALFGGVMYLWKSFVGYLVGDGCWLLAQLLSFGSGIGKRKNEKILEGSKG